MTCLVCNTSASIQAVKKAIKLTLKNKLASNTPEVKGTNTSLTVKKYFFKQLIKNAEWEIMSIAADKQAWLNFHEDKVVSTSDKNLFYDEVAKRLLSQIKFLENSSQIQIIVDKSKTQSALNAFDLCITSMIRTYTKNNTLLTIHHRHSFADPGLQATDMFGWGIYRKYQQNEIEWYEVFSQRIALEMEFKF